MLIDDHFQKKKSTLRVIMHTPLFIIESNTYRTPHQSGWQKLAIVENQKLDGSIIQGSEGIIYLQNYKEGIRSQRKWQFLCYARPNSFINSELRNVGNY